jgi:5-methylcytosine-specific restriction endonuclease McrA
MEKSIEAGKQNFQLANERRKAEAAIKRQARWETTERKRLIKKLIKLMKMRATALRKEEAKSRQNQHGLVVGDYSRCKKLNGTACQPCKAIAAQYVRELWHTDPKYKAKEKEWYRNNPGKHHKNKNKKRVKGGKHRAYTRNQIIKRDGISCYLCNTPVDFTATHIQGQPGWETYPHIEHVIPLALGGDDTLENVKLAHAKCNIDKGVQLLATA